MLLKLAMVVLLTAFQGADVETAADGVEVTERYTLRIKQPGSSVKPRLRALAIAPDGKQVAIATSNELLFARSADGEIESRVRYSPFSMAYSNDSRQLFTISERQSKMFQVAPPAEIPSSFSRPQGYLGVQIQEKNGKLVIASVEPNSPASDADLIVGSELVGIGEGSGTTIDSVTGMSLKRVLPKLDGPPNTKVTFAVIPRGKIDESKVTMTRMLIKSSGGYEPVPTPERAESVAWCMVNGFHELRSSRNGNYVSSLRCEQIKNDRGSEAISKDGEWFAFVAQYKDLKSATLKVGQSLDSESSSQNSPPVSGPALHKLGYKQGDRRIYGAEIYNIRTQELVASFPVAFEPFGRGGKVFIGVQLDPIKKQIVVGTPTTLHVYNTETGERISTIKPEPSDDSVYFKSLAVAGDYAAVGDSRGVVRMVNLESKQLVETIPSREKRSVTHVDLSQDAKTLTYHADGVAHIVHLEIGK